MPNLKEVRTRTTGGLFNPSGQPYNSRGLPPDPRDQYGGGGGFDRRRLPGPGGSRELTRGEAEELMNKEHARRVAYSSTLPQRESTTRTVYPDTTTISNLPQRESTTRTVYPDTTTISKARVQEDDSLDKKLFRNLFYSLLEGFIAGGGEITKEMEDELAGTTEEAKESSK